MYNYGYNPKIRKRTSRLHICNLGCHNVWLRIYTSKTASVYCKSVIVVFYDLLDCSCNTNASCTQAIVSSCQEKLPFDTCNIIMWCNNRTQPVFCWVDTCICFRCSTDSKC